MKKIYTLALLLAGTMTMVNAQQQDYHLSPGHIHTARTLRMRPNTTLQSARTIHQNPSTQSASQWVSYYYSKDLDWGGPGVSELNANYLFPDSTVLGNFGTWDYVWVHSIADVFDPTAPTFANNYPGYSVTRSDPYTVDSIGIIYAYGRNINVTDTLIIYLFNNNSASNLAANGFIAPTATNYNTDTVTFKGLKYYGQWNAPSSSSTSNAAVAGVQIMKIPLTIADTSMAFFNEKLISTNSFMVPAGKLTAVAVDFKPGYTYNLGDTLDTQLNWFLFGSYEEGGGGASGGTYPIYYDCNYQASNCDYNCSFITRTQERYNVTGNGWNGYYIPKYAFTQPYSLENHGIEYKITSPPAGVNEISDNGLTLDQNVPNPVDGGSTIINYSLRDAGNVVMTVFDVTGKQVEVFNKGHQAAGAYQLDLNTGDLTSGVYFYTLNVDGKQLTKRMVITQ